MMQKVCVIIPIYHEIPLDNEIFSIDQTKKQLPNCKIFFAAPKSLNIEWYQEHYPQIEIRKYSKWKNTIQSYSDLLMSPSFYKQYSDFEYMLISQTDALVLGDELQLMKFCDLGYDYIGAPWEMYKESGGRDIPKYRIKKWQKNILLRKLAKVRKCLVGNGGFSLRNVESCVKLLNGHWFSKLLWNYNEDLFFAYYQEQRVTSKEASIKIASYEDAIQFAREENLREAAEKGALPFGVHAWEKDWPGLRAYLIEKVKE